MSLKYVLEPFDPLKGDTTARLDAATMAFSTAEAMPNLLTFWSAMLFLQSERKKTCLPRQLVHGRRSDPGLAHGATGYRLDPMVLMRRALPVPRHPRKLLVS